MERDALRKVVLLAVTVMAVAMALRRFGDGLWLDEAGTYWVIRDGWRETYDRALRFQGQSPLYYLIAWFAVHCGGARETVLRLPSALAFAGATAVLHRLARRIFDAETALYAAIFFVASFGSEASNARPYAIALFFIMSAMLSLVRFVETGALASGVSYAIFAALTVYEHYLCGTIFFVHAIYVLERGFGKAGPTRVVGAVGLAGLLLLPLVGQFLSLLGRSQSLVFVPKPDVIQVLVVLVPPWLPAGIILGAVLGAQKERLSLVMPGPAADVKFAAIWHVLPILIMWTISTLTPLSLFVARYFIAAAPGLALLAALAVRSFESARTRTLVMAAVGILACTFTATDSRHLDLRDIANEARSNIPKPATPVFVESGFVESMQLPWFEDQEKRSYLLAPLSLYPLEGDIVGLPQNLKPDGVAYLSSALAQKLPGADTVVVVAPWEDEYPAWFEGRLLTEGFKRRPTREGVTVFERK
jgi:mannosyltransferase